MKTTLKAVIAAIVVVVLIVPAALYLTQPALFNATPQTTATPEATPVPTPTLTPAPSTEPTITITYHSVDLGCGRQCADITVRNVGYATFPASLEKFFVTINGKNYTYSVVYQPTWGSWANTAVSNGGSYSGSIVFDSPKTTSSFAFGYNDTAFHIVDFQT
jgi:hypothetical protein